MLVNLDQSTLANMTAALEHVCRKVGVEKDSPQLRKMIANEIVACASKGSRTFIDFQNVGLKVLTDSTRRPKPVWQIWRRK